MSPIISNKGLPLPQPSTSISSATPRPISPKTQAPSSSSLIMPASSSVPASSSAITSQAGSSSGNLPPSSSNRLPITIPFQPKAMRPNSPSRRPSLRTGSSAQPSSASSSMPPPSLPHVPAALSAGLAPSTIVEQTPEERRAMWEERTR